MEEIHSPPSPMEILSTTHRDYQAGGFQPTPPTTTQVLPATLHPKGGGSFHATPPTRMGFPLFSYSPTTTTWSSPAASGWSEPTACP